MARARTGSFPFGVFRLITPATLFAVAESLLRQLPLELVLQILHHAARDSIVKDRAWVVNLALVSRFAYELVRPVLHQTMVVNEDNKRQVTALAQNRASAHVFHAVRCLVCDESLRYQDSDDVCRLLAGVTSIDAPLGLIKVLSTSPDFHPRIMAVRYCWFSKFADDLPRTTLASVTHLAGYFPSGSPPDNALTDGRIAHIIDALPALTHFGLDVLDLSKFDDRSDDDDDSAANDGLEEEPIDLDALEGTLRAILSYPQIQVVAMRVGGDWAVHWPDILAIALRLQDTRVHAWNDTRPMPSWAREGQYASSDVWAGRSIWTESSQVWNPPPTQYSVSHGVALLVQPSIE